MSSPIILDLSVKRIIMAVLLEPWPAYDQLLNDALKHLTLTSAAVDPSNEDTINYYISRSIHHFGTAETFGRHSGETRRTSLVQYKKGRSR